MNEGGKKGRMEMNEERKSVGKEKNINCGKE